MFAIFDDTNFPIIKVKFTDDLTENNFDLFLKNGYQYMNENNIV